MREVLGLIGASVVAVSALYYVIDVLRGRTRPQRTSWAVWAVVGVLGFGATHEGGAGPGAWAAGVDAVACAVTFLISLHPRYGKAGGLRLDPLLVVLGVAGVVLWRWGMLGMNAAALCAVGCELPGLWPTLREAWRQPAQESLLSWSADLLGHGCALAAVATASLAALTYPIYALVATTLVSLTLVVRRGRTPAVEAPVVGPERDRILRMGPLLVTVHEPERKPERTSGTRRRRE